MKWSREFEWMDSSQLSFKEIGRSELSLRKAAKALCTVSKLCVKTLFTSEKFHS